MLSFNIFNRSICWFIEVKAWVGAASFKEHIFKKFSKGIKLVSGIETCTDLSYTETWDFIFRNLLHLGSLIKLLNAKKNIWKKTNSDFSSFLIYSVLQLYLLIIYTVFSLDGQKRARVHICLWLWVTIQSLGIEHRASGKAAGTLNLWSTSPGMVNVYCQLNRM